MKLRNFVAAASTALLLFAGAANAATVSAIPQKSVAGDFAADFNVTAVNVTNVNRKQSQASWENFEAALAGTLGRAESVYNTGKFTYSGLVDFGKGNRNDPTVTTIGSFIESGSGATNLDLSSAFAGLTNSTTGFRTSTATTTFYLFEAVGDYTAGTFDISHDDGVQVKGVGGYLGPNGVKGTRIEGFEGGALSFLYVSANDDPSIFRVDSDVSPVPLPAAAWMMLMGVVGLGAASRRRKAA